MLVVIPTEGGVSYFVLISEASCGVKKWKKKREWQIVVTVNIGKITNLNRRELLLDIIVGEWMIITLILRT